MEKINKLSLPATIVIGAFILGGFYYYSQVNKQESIERQQQLEMSAEKEMNNKQYIAEQKSSCLSIYETEGKKWNNVSGWRYDDVKDACYIEYKASPRLTKAECDAKYKGEDGKVAPFFFMEYLLCQDGLFEKSF
mgnify:CR=1 FL=1